MKYLVPIKNLIPRIFLKKSDDSLDGLVLPTCLIRRVFTSKKLVQGFCTLRDHNQMPLLFQAVPVENHGRIVSATWTPPTIASCAVTACFAHSAEVDPKMHLTDLREWKCDKYTLN